MAPPNNAFSVEGRNIRTWLHPLAAHIYDLTIERALNRPNVTTIARALSRSTRQLERLFEQATLPPPQRLVILARWLPVANVLGKQVASTGDIARSLGISSTQALCRAVRRELHMSICDIRGSEAPSLIARDLITAYQDPAGCREMATACREWTTGKDDTASYVRNQPSGSRRLQEGPGCQYHHSQIP